jgi:hypothetical protein
MNRRIDQALSGSDVIQGYTDQGSAGDPNYVRGGVGININRERFNDWGYPGSREFRQELQSGYAEAQRRGALNPDRTALDRGAIDKSMSVNATGKLSVDVNAPPGTKVEASGTGPFKNTELQRSAQMPYTQSGPSVSETANSYQ